MSKLALVGFWIKSVTRTFGFFRKVTFSKVSVAEFIFELHSNFRATCLTPDLMCCSYA
jgi:hypothetical protein